MSWNSSLCIHTREYKLNLYHSLAIIIKFLISWLILTFWMTLISSNGCRLHTKNTAFLVKHLSTSWRSRKGARAWRLWGCTTTKSTPFSHSLFNFFSSLLLLIFFLIWNWVIILGFKVVIPYGGFQKKLYQYSKSSLFGI